MHQYIFGHDEAVAAFVAQQAAPQPQLQQQPEGGGLTQAMINDPRFAPVQGYGGGSS